MRGILIQALSKIIVTTTHADDYAINKVKYIYLNGVHIMVWINHKSFLGFFTTKVIEAITIPEIKHKL